jgi:ribonucleotide monophosphatase NagD (HAD superfamily)
MGWHPDCGMKDIEIVCNAIWGGAKLYVASDVPFFASKQGRTIGYSYAITAAIRRMTKVPAIITGKPSQYALSYLARHLGVRKSEVGVVGDDPLVEMIMARRGAGMALHGHHQSRTVAEAAHHPQTASNHRERGELP